MPSDCPKSLTPVNPDAETPDLSDPLRLAYVRERAINYQLNIPAKLQLLEDLSEMTAHARRSYLENLSKP